jgi:hypothetical protein
LQLSWTDERVEMTEETLGDGLSASQIAAQLGGVSRNAVIGKVHGSICRDARKRWTEGKRSTNRARLLAACGGYAGAAASQTTTSRRRERR